MRPLHCSRHAAPRRRRPRRGAPLPVQDGRAAAAAEVGTVFARGDLTGFYDETSFVPFAAVVDGRQRLADVAAEVPWAYLVLGALFGVASEAATLLVIDASAPW